MEMEEEGAEGGFILEDNRVRKASINFDLIERKGVMTCLKMEKETGKLVEKEKEITW